MQENKGRRILLQNENGPCPLLAAANALLLKGYCTLPPASVRNGVATLEDVTNMLAEQAMKAVNSNENEHHAIYVDELVKHIPTFQYGMDVNPSFTQGITGYEYTAQLTAFDMLRCRLVHGWLVDIQDEETFKAIGTKTYNELVEKVIHGKETTNEIQRLQTEIAQLQQQQEAPVDLLDDDNKDDQKEEEALVGLLDDDNKDDQKSELLQQLQTKLTDLQTKAHDALLVGHFFESTGHQLTPYGLTQVQEHVQEDELCVFFRNNHFNTLTKHEGHLYLLVTDLGYANSPAIIWERLDVIDGDTDYVNSQFKAAGTQARLLASGPTLTPEQMMAASNQNDADYQLALSLSTQNRQQIPNHQPQSSSLDVQEGEIMAAATEASLREYHGLSNNVESASEEKREERVEVGVPVVSSNTKPTPATQEDADRMLAMQLQADTNGARHHHEDASFHLAHQLQEEENQKARVNRARQQRRNMNQQSSSTSGCVIS